MDRTGEGIETGAPPGDAIVPARLANAQLELEYYGEPLALIRGILSAAAFAALLAAHVPGNLLYGWLVCVTAFLVLRAVAFYGFVRIGWFASPAARAGEGGWHRLGRRLLALREDF